MSLGAELIDNGKSMQVAVTGIVLFAVALRATWKAAVSP